MSGFVIRTNHVPFDWVICKIQEIRITATGGIRIIEDSVKSTKFNNNQVKIPATGRKAQLPVCVRSVMKEKLSLSASALLWCIPRNDPAHIK
jgi:hypothetical protein